LLTSSSAINPLPSLSKPCSRGAWLLHPADKTRHDPQLSETISARMRRNNG